MNSTNMKLRLTSISFYPVLLPLESSFGHKTLFFHSQIDISLVQIILVIYNNGWSRQYRYVILVNTIIKINLIWYFRNQTRFEDMIHVFHTIVNIIIANIYLSNIYLTFTLIAHSPTLLMNFKFSSYS